MIAIVFDTETTGLLNPKASKLGDQPYITDIYCAKIEQADNEIQVIESFETLIKPPIPLTPEITRITGLTDADLDGAPTFIEIWEELAEFFTGAQRMVAHNLQFDKTMLANELHRSGKVLNFPWPMENVCTVEKTMFFEQRRLSLQKLYKFLFKEEFKDAHRAKPDVEALIRCYGELFNRGVV